MRTKTTFKKGHAPSYTKKGKEHSRYRHGHGSVMSRSPLYMTWTRMKSRCQNPNNPRYKDYGGRGIKVCIEWQDFENFRRDMEPTYAKGLSIDRIDVNGDYEKSNCQWLTMAEQQRNKRSNNTRHVLSGVLAAIEAGANPVEHIKNVMKVV